MTGESSQPHILDAIEGFKKCKGSSEQQGTHNQI